MQSEIMAGVLAGGKSSRFGSPKEKAFFKNVTLLEDALSLAKSLTSKVVVLAGGKSGGQIHAVPCIADDIPDTGPLGAICTALRISPAPWVAIVPCDMPLLTPEVYDFLYRYSEFRKPIVALSAKGTEPLVSIWPKNALPAARHRVLDNRLNVHDCLLSLEAIQVNLPLLMPDFSQAMLSNVNYQSDLVELESSPVAWTG